jgi:hypothetical protein
VNREFPALRFITWSEREREIARKIFRAPRTVPHFIASASSRKLSRKRNAELTRQAVKQDLPACGQLLGVFRVSV